MSRQTDLQQRILNDRAPIQPYVTGACAIQMMFVTGSCPKTRAQGGQP